MAAAVAGAFLLAGLEMFHSILDSLIIFGALDTGDAGFGYLSWLGWFSYTIVGNVLGGLVLVTLLRLVRSRELLQEERNAVENEDATAAGDRE
jgi:formate-nitrite transporter family protein